MCFGGLCLCLFNRKQQLSASPEIVGENYLLNVHPPTSKPPIGVPIAAHSLTTPRSEVSSKHSSQKVAGIETSNAKVSLTIGEEKLADISVRHM
jgi:hypothetical protein